MILNKPLKKFGQNYLTDKYIVNKIVEVINPLPNDSIIEIGPGRGAMTAELIRFTPNLTLIEIDRRVIEDLACRFPEARVIEADFLKTDLKEIISGSTPVRIVGNIPYNITSPIIFRLIENRDIIKDSVMMIQHEVATRLSAGPGNRDYGILSVILGYFAEIEYCFKVSPEVFYPKPKVDSAVIKISFRDQSQLRPVNEKLFFQTVKASFGNRRKTLKNSLMNSIFSERDFSNFPVDLNLRAERLSIDDYLNITDYFDSNSGNYERKNT